MSQATAIPIVTVPSSPTLLKAAFEQFLPQRQALAADRVLRVNVDVPEAVSRALAAAERLAGFADELGALPRFDLPLVQEFGARALALLHSHHAYLNATGDADRVKAGLETVIPARRLLLYKWGPTAVAWGAFTADDLARWTAGSGHVDAANDVVVAGNAYLAAWSKVDGKVQLTRAEVEAAVADGTALLQALGQRELKVTLRDAQDDLRRSFTLFVQAWSEAQRGLTYLRWYEEDVEEILGSIWETSGGRPRKPKEPAAPQP